MLQQIMTYASMIAMALAGLLWIQTTFVSAGDFQQYERQNYEDQVYRLVVKQAELRKEGKELDSWEKAELERARKRLDQVNSK